MSLFSTSFSAKESAMNQSKDATHDPVSAAFIIISLRILKHLSPSFSVLPVGRRSSEKVRSAVFWLDAELSDQKFDWIHAKLHGGEDVSGQPDSHASHQENVLQHVRVNTFV